MSNTALAEMPTPVIFTDNAARKVKELLDEEGDPSLKLRIYITGGGCSGFQYGFKFDDAVQADDLVVEKQVVLPIAAEIETSPASKQAQETTSTFTPATVASQTSAALAAKPAANTTSVQLLVDSLSLQYLMGAEIDYKEDIEGAQFIIRNPQAKTTCGCGSSFTPKMDEE